MSIALAALVAKARRFVDMAIATGQIEQGVNVLEAFTENFEEYLEVPPDEQATEKVQEFLDMMDDLEYGVEPVTCDDLRALVPLFLAQDMSSLCDRGPAIVAKMDLSEIEKVLTDKDSHAHMDAMLEGSVVRLMLTMAARNNPADTVIELFLRFIGPVDVVNHLCADLAHSSISLQTVRDLAALVKTDHERCLRACKEALAR